jgi:hypothetical protein
VHQFIPTGSSTLHGWLSLPATFAIPAGLVPGFRLGFQAAELSPTNVLSTTNPVVFGVW